MAQFAALFGGGGAAAGGSAAAGAGANSGAALAGINAAGAASGSLFKPVTLDQFQASQAGGGSFLSGGSSVNVPQILKGAGTFTKSFFGGISAKVQGDAEAAALRFSGQSDVLEARRANNELNRRLSPMLAARGAEGNLTGSSIDTLAAEEERTQTAQNINILNARISEEQKRLAAKLAKRRGKLGLITGVLGLS